MAQHLRRGAAVVVVELVGERRPQALDDVLAVALVRRRGVGVELRKQLALRQRDDASELAEAPVLDRDELPLPLGRRRVLLDELRAQDRAVGERWARAQLRPQQLTACRSVLP